MRLPGRIAGPIALLLVATTGIVAIACDRSVAAAGAHPLQAVLLTPSQVTAEAIRRFRGERLSAVVVNLVEGEGKEAASAAVRSKKAGLDVYYWIEVGRSPTMAREHPQWMASLQGHPEWRRHFPGTPKPAPGEVVKNYPWVPIYYREAFDAHLLRVKALLQDVPPAKGVFLNDLQAAPSACGCGNLFCRWTPDYGPIRTATPMPANAAAEFVAGVRAFGRAAEIIPVWTTECEEHESAKGMACDGVPCFGGICWKSWTEQLMPLAKEIPVLAALTPYRAFQRDHPRYGLPAGWVKSAVASFAEMPPKRGGTPVPSGRIVAVLQGWDVTPDQRRAQIERSRDAGARGFVLAEMPIEQGWEPRIIKAEALRSPRTTPAANTHHHPIAPL